MISTKSVTSNVTGVTTVTIPQVSSEYVPTPTVSAYLNATSSTGRTISFTGDDYTGLGIPDINDNYYRATAHIFYNGVDVFADPNGLSASLGWDTWQVYFERGITSYASTTDHWQIPIPENWPAGTYNITWEAQWNNYSQSNSGNTSVTVPELPAPTVTPPTPITQNFAIQFPPAEPLARPRPRPVRSVATRNHPECVREFPQNSPN